MEYIEVFFNDVSELIIDSWQSLIVTENFSKPNSFSLVLGFSTEYIEKLKPGTTLLIDDKFYYIDRVLSDGIRIRVAGKGLAQYADRKIIKGRFAANDYPIAIARTLVLDYTNLAVANLSGTNQTKIRYEKSHGNILEEIENLCETYDFGFIETKTQLVFSEGRDVSGLVEFSTNFENLIAEQYENHDYDLKNVAYVYGEGEGAARKFVIVNDEITGLNRRELYVDARDLRQEDLTNAQYREALRARGEQKLAEHRKLLSLEGEIDINNKLYEFGKDYSIGDLVTITSDKFNLTRKQRLTSLTRTWDEQGFHIDPVFDYDSQTYFLRR